MKKKDFLNRVIKVVLLLLISSYNVYSQCNTLRPQIDITFNTDKDCAPTTVTDFTIKYFFNVPQNPADIIIHFDWNDPTNATTDVDIYSGLVVTGGNMEFQATGTFMYPVNTDCSFLPTSYIFINGVLCPTSAQEQTAFSWARDNEFGAALAINPIDYEVCYGNAITNAVFVDNSSFNCNINIEPDNPNRQERHVQFIYGTNHNASASISDLSLNDGIVQTLTDATGALVTTDTRGTAGLMVTGAYFGPVENVVFPADGPVSATFPMSAPANVLNVVGNQFEITMFNWNTCNPFNGDIANPNYDEAISTTAYITIVAAPSPSFQTRKNDITGILSTNFCIGDDIFFENLTADTGLNYSWEFFEDTVPTLPAIYTSTENSPIYAYTSGGQKLIRLTAINSTAQGACSRTTDIIVNITPTVTAGIAITDFSNNTVEPNFCQDVTNTSVFNVRFHDNAIGDVNANTQYRWEFYDENGTLSREEPSSGYSATSLASFDETYTIPGSYLVRYLIRDAATLCESVFETYINIYNSPVANFTSNNICEGEDVHFEDMSSLTAINGESIVLYEWDFSYDGISFDKDAAYDNQTVFDKNIGDANIYNVALRITSDSGCQDIFQTSVNVQPLPTTTFSVNQSEGCSMLPVEFTNTSVMSQSTSVSNYLWEIDNKDGLGFIPYLNQDPADATFQDVFIAEFENTTFENDTVDIRLRVLNDLNCEAISEVQQIIIFPTPQTSFSAINYNPFANNCEQITVDFEVSALTKALNPTQYTWRIEDENGLVQPDEVYPSSITTFSYNFINTSSTNYKDYSVSLIPNFIGGCASISSTTIRVNPVPESTFTVDTLFLDCDVMQVVVESDQKGLNMYTWSMEINNVPIFTSTTLGDRFEHEFYRPEIGNEDLLVSIVLTTQNFAGCVSDITQTYFSVPGKENINPSFTVTPTSQIFPDATITVTNTSSSGTWDYLWNFGDGTTSNDENIGSHTYAVAGEYIISLTVGNGDCTETIVQTIFIESQKPIVDFDVIPTEGCAPVTVSFTNTTQYALEDSYVWNFGDGSTSKVKNPTHTYYQSGTYTVSLTANNSIGETGEAIKEQVVYVYDNPIALFEVRPAEVYLPNPIYINNNSFDATSFQWDFGDGNTSEDFEPIHIYEKENTDVFGNPIGYDISLIATSKNGCSDTTTVEGAVVAHIKGDMLIPNAFSPSLTGSNGGEWNAEIGTNDVFLPIMRNATTFHMLIFNRWGELLFESNSANRGWDGYYKGKLVPQDVYVYKLKVSFNDGNVETRIGDVTLIR
ncbi:MAG: PKD domain-containing protein [Cyclobacteriaceae bacterium]|nr:PKD domain-containing protein [Cyclobacteriaceae bacterium]